MKGWTVNDQQMINFLDGLKRVLDSLEVGLSEKANSYQKVIKTLMEWEKSAKAQAGMVRVLTQAIQETIDDLTPEEVVMGSEGKSEVNLTLGLVAVPNAAPAMARQWVSERPNA